MNNNLLQKLPAQQEYKTLGNKVFWLFVLQTSPVTCVLLVLSVIFFILSYQPFMANTIFGNVQNYTLGATLVAFILALITFAISTALARLNYKNYVFAVGDDSFKIKRGIFSKTENAIPYRQIQNVDIECSVMFQMLGLSRLIILTAGHEDEKPNGSGSGDDEAEGIIPAIDQKLAEWLQAELLKRSNIQKVIESK